MAIGIPDQEITIFDAVQREIEFYNYYSKIFSVFPQSLIAPQQVRDVLLFINHLENNNASDPLDTFDLPRLDSAFTVRLVEDMLRSINSKINARTIIDKITTIVRQYRQLPPIQMSPENVMMLPNEDKSVYKVCLDFNFMNFTFFVPRTFISAIQSKMGNSSHLSKIVLIYAMRLHHFHGVERFRWGLFLDLDHVCEQFAYHRRKPKLPDRAAILDGISVIVR